MDKFKKFLGNGKWRQWKKSDWVVLALVGVLLLVITLPMDSGKKENVKEPAQGDAAAQTEGKGEGDGTSQGAGGAVNSNVYGRELEERLEEVLGRMEGVGKVEVMISLADTGEQIVEKDSSVSTSATSETDSAGGTRTTSENSSNEETIFVDTGEEKYPYVQKEKLPAIEGVVVVAEGGGNPATVSDISDAIKALFPVEAHRIKVVKMCSKEE